MIRLPQIKLAYTMWIYMDIHVCIYSGKVVCKSYEAQEAHLIGPNSGSVQQ